MRYWERLYYPFFSFSLWRKNIVCLCKHIKQLCLHFWHFHSRKIIHMACTFQSLGLGRNTENLFCSGRMKMWGCLLLTGEVPWERGTLEPHQTTPISWSFSLCVFLSSLYCFEKQALAFVSLYDWICNACLWARLFWSATIRQFSVFVLMPLFGRCPLLISPHVNCFGNGSGYWGPLPLSVCSAFAQRPTSRPSVTER